MCIIARELALTYSGWPMRPIVAVHVPGLANVLPDLLSRMAQPGHDAAIPAALAQVEVTPVPVRGAAFYATRVPLKAAVVTA